MTNQASEEAPTIPIQNVLLVGCAVYTIDMEGTLFLSCVCPSRYLAEEITLVLARHYGVQAKQSNLDIIPGVTMAEFAATTTES